jgi:hypothetical protein
MPTIAQRRVEIRSNAPQLSGPRNARTHHATGVLKSLLGSVQITEVPPSFLGQEPHGDRQAVYRDERSGRGVRALGGQIHRRSARVGQEVPRGDGLRGRTSSLAFAGNVRPTR